MKYVKIVSVSWLKWIQHNEANVIADFVEFSSAFAKFLFWTEDWALNFET